MGESGIIYCATLKNNCSTRGTHDIFLNQPLKSLNHTFRCCCLCRWLLGEGWWRQWCRSPQWEAGQSGRCIHFSEQSGSFHLLSLTRNTFVSIKTVLKIISYSNLVTSPYLIVILLFYEFCLENVKGLEWTWPFVERFQETIFYKMKSVPQRKEMCIFT